MVPPRPLSDRSIYLDTDPLHHFPAMAVAGHYNRHSHALSFCSPNCSRCAPQRQWFVSLLRSMPLHPMSVKVLFRFFSDARIAGEDLPDVAVWVGAVMEVYRRAKGSVLEKHTELERSRLKEDFERELIAPAKPYLNDKAAPQGVLAEWIAGFISELFAFVGNPEVPSENNAAERAIRPAVVARKISGGSRSARGSKTCSIPRTLFENWNLQGRNAIDACREMIICSADAQTVSAQQQINSEELNSLLPR